MKYLFVSIFVLLSLSGLAQDLKLWYNEPAQQWTEGLPIGNGRLMGMVLGGVHMEQIQLNEESLWTGAPVMRDKPGAWKYLAQIRQLMFEGKYYEAERLTKERMLGLRLSIGMHTYQELGNLNLKFTYSSADPVSDYRRELDLETGIVSVSYNVGEVTYSREVFSSPVDNAIIIHLSCDQPGKLSFSAGLARKGATIEKIDPGTMAMHGVALSAVNAGWPGVDYEAQMKVKTVNGRLSSNAGGFRIDNADEVCITLVASTNYFGDVPRIKCHSTFNAMAQKSYLEQKKAHIEEHQRLFKRVELNLGTTKASKLPLNERLKAFKNGTFDPQLLALYFQFGRYLLISSSRPGSLAVNLWGKWVKGLNPAYDADYHININIQMNYWLAEMCNLSECQEPFIDLIDSLRTRGRITAKETYNCKGFVAHYATDAWYYTAANGNPPYAMWPMAPAWGCQHMWEHYLFGRDKDYLAQKSYPIMKEAAEFFVDYLVEHPKTGFLVSGPSTSPENRFIDENGKSVSLSLSPTMDNQLIFDLFSNTIEASKVLGVDEEFRSELENLRSRLMPMKIGEDGRLLEWSESFKEQNKGHRHISHLWGLCPGNQITEDTSELFEAARKSLEVRVANGAAESPEYQGIAAWVTGCYVRLLDGDKAINQVSEILKNSSWPNLFAVGERGREREMFETDVNFGVSSAIAEMLIQSHAGYINLLPALPQVLSHGRVKGLRARGGFEVEIEWKDGKLITTTVISLDGQPCRLKYGKKTIGFETTAGGEYTLNADLKKI